MKVKEITDSLELMAMGKKKLDPQLLMKAAQLLDAGRMIRDGLLSMEGPLAAISQSAKLGVQCWDTMVERDHKTPDYGAGFKPGGHLHGAE